MTKLLKSNIHKDRSILIAFLLIITICVLLLHIGCFLGCYEDYYDSEYESRGYYKGGIINTVGDKDEIRKIVEDVDSVKNVRITDSVMCDYFDYSTDRKDKVERLDLMSYSTFDGYNLADDLKFVEKDDSIQGPKIYLNLYTATNEKLKVGDKMYFKSEDMGEYEFTLAGIYEDLVEGNAYSYYSAIIDNETYDTFDEKAEELMLEGKNYYRMELVSCEFKDGVDQSDGVADVNDALRNAGYNATGYVTDLAREGYIGIVKIVSGFLTVFAVVVMAICLIMIIFTVNNNIDRDIVNIGALRAVGHTVSQIRAALAMEYVVLGSIGSVVGTFIAYLIMPAFDKNVLRQLSGLCWDEHFYPGITFGILAAMLLIILLVVFVSTGKIRNLHPATALRFGLKANSFKKNHLPLDETNGSLDILLALKSTFQNMGQNLIVFGIIFVVGFLTMFSAILLYNTRVDITMFQRLMQGDAPDAYVEIEAESEDEMYSIIEKLQDMDEVTQAYGLSSEAVSVAGYDTRLLYVSKPEYVYCGLYDGEMIQEANEAVVGKAVADKAGVGIGDEIEVEYKGKKARFLVTGFQQAVFGMGERVYVTDDGARRLGMDIEHHTIRIRVKDATPEKVDDVLKDVEKLLGDNLVSTENWLKHNKSNDNLPVFAVSMIVTVLVFLNIITVIIVIRLLLKTVFIRREKEFGIKKAVGFTSRQLRVQLALSLIPTSIIGSIMGALMAHLMTNPLFSLIFRGFGVMKAALIMRPELMILTVIIVTLMVFAFSFIMSGRMKKVSAYRLIQE